MGPGVFEERRALGRVGERRLRWILREDLRRQRVEGRGDRRRARGPRIADEAADERLVPEVHAVEHADREMQRAARPAGEVVEDYSVLPASTAATATIDGGATIVRSGIVTRRRRLALTGRASRTRNGIADATARM